MMNNELARDGIAGGNNIRYINKKGEHKTRECDHGDIEEAETLMDNDDLLKEYINKLDQDKRDQEQRLSQSMQSMEQRITDERRLSEERMEKRYKEVMDTFEKMSINMDAKIDKMDSKLDSKLDKLDNKFENLKWWILGTTIAIILAFVAIVFSIK